MHVKVIPLNRNSAMTHHVGSCPNWTQSRNCSALKMLVKTKNNCSSDIDVHWPSKLFLYSPSSLFNFVVLLTSFFSSLLFCMFRVAEAAYSLALQLHFYVVHSFISTACSLHCISYLVSSLLSDWVFCWHLKFQLLPNLLYQLDLAGCLPIESCSHVT